MRMASIVAALVAAAGAASAQTVVLNFDDLPGSGPVPPGYGGIADWNGWQYYDFNQPPYNPSSGATRVYNTANGNIGFGTDYVFDGAFFNGHGSGNGYLPIYFDLYNDGFLVHTSASIALDGSGNGIFLNSGYGGFVDQVVVNGSQGFYIMDDFTYTIPAPGALAALGLGGLVAARRRR